MPIVQLACQSVTKNKNRGQGNQQMQIVQSVGMTIGQTNTTEEAARRG